MVLGMIFNVMVAAPLLLMVIQFARTKQPAERRRPVPRRPDDVWAVYQRTMGADAERPAPAERPAGPDRSSQDGRSAGGHPLVEPRIVPRRPPQAEPGPRNSTAPIAARFRPAR